MTGFFSFGFPKCYKNLWNVRICLPFKKTNSRIYNADMKKN